MNNGVFNLFPSPLYHGSGQIVQNDSLVMTRFPGGFLDGNGKARYYMTDYQGNNIAVINSEGTVIDRMGYYPYGLPWDIPASTDFLFADKEYQHLSGLDEYIHGARRSVPYACAFSTPDALCEKRPWESPYLFCDANPVRYIDPTGNKFTETSEVYVNKLITDTQNCIFDLLLNMMQQNNEERENSFSTLGELGKMLYNINSLNDSDTLYDIKIDPSLADENNEIGYTRLQYKR